MLIWIGKDRKKYTWNYRRFWRNILPYLMIILFFIILGIVGKWDAESLLVKL